LEVFIIARRVIADVIMGRPSKTASPTPTAQTAPADKPKIVVAYGPAKSSADNSPQRSESELLKSFESLPGIMPGMEDEPPAEAKKENPSERPKTQEIEGDDDTENQPKSKKETKPKETKALLPDEDEEDDSEESEDDDEAEPEGKVEDKKIAEKLFKAREKKRELKAKVAAAEARAAELESKLSGVLTNTAPIGELFTGVYEGVKTTEDLDRVRDHLQNWVDYLEDNSDGYMNGETEVEAKEAKAQLRAYRNELKRSSKIESFFENREKSAAKAKELYPWVSNVSSKRHDLVLDLAKEFPEVSRSAHSSLLLGRLSIAKLVESGEYTLVKKGTVTAAPGKEKASPKVTRQEPIEQAQEQSPIQRQRQRPPTAQDLEERFMSLLGSSQ